MALTGDRRRQLLGAGLAGLWLAAVLIIDQATEPSFVPAVLYGVAPLIASAAVPPAATAGFGVIAVALTAMSLQWNGAWGTAQAWIRISDVALVAAAGVVLGAVRTRRERQLLRVSRIAEVAQRAVLPLVPTRVGTVAVGARYVSAAEDALVGGDLYDWFHSDRRVCFVVGDVRGKGINAVEQAARVIRAFRQSAAGGADLAAVAAEVSAYLAPFLDAEEFVTAALVQVSGEQVALVSCGHPQPLLIAADGAARLVDLPPCLPLGLGRSYESVTVPWAPGDRLLLYTDGLSEARDAHDEFLPVLPLAPLLHTATVEAALDNVLTAVRQHVPKGRFTDDLAVLLLENAAGREEQVAADPRDSLVSSPAPLPMRLASQDASTAQPAPGELIPGNRPASGPVIGPRDTI